MTKFSYRVLFFKNHIGFTLFDCSFYTFSSFQKIVIAVNEHLITNVIVIRIVSVFMCIYS